MSILVSHESQNPKCFQKVPGAPKSRSAQGLCVCSHQGHTACSMVSWARYMRLCPNHGGTKAYVSNIPQTSNRPSKKQEIKPEIICGPSPAGHGGRAEARSARVGSGFIPAAAHVEPSRERPEEESLSIQLDCTTLTQKNLKASDRTNPSGPYYKDTSQSEPTKQQKKTFSGVKLNIPLPHRSHFWVLLPSLHHFNYYVSNRRFRSPEPKVSFVVLEISSV